MTKPALDLMAALKASLAEAAAAEAATKGTAEMPGVKAAIKEAREDLHQEHTSALGRIAAELETIAEELQMRNRRQGIYD